MTEDMVFCIAYVAAVVVGLALLLLMCEGLFNLMYRFIPAFRRRMDRFFESLQQCDDD